jgi:hypothetical protein
MATAIALMLGYDKNLVVVPPILITPWLNWLTQMGCDVVAYRGTPAKRKLIDLKRAAWVVMSHDIFRRDFDHIKASLSRVRYSLILDEAQALKSPKSLLFRLVLQITAGEVGLQLLTGTPISSILDSYSYIKLKTPGVYRSYKAFTNTHVKEYDFYNNPKEFQNLDSLRTNFEIQTITGTKEEFHGFRVEPFFPDAAYELDPEHYRLYVQLVDEQLLTLVDGEVLVLDGGTSAWIKSGLPTIADNPLLASPPIDRYRRPYEGTDNPHSEMQAYLDWEFGLVEQLARDGTHGFRVLI